MKTFTELLTLIVATRKQKFGTPESLTRARLILMVDVNPEGISPERDRDPAIIAKLKKAAADLGVSV